MSDNYIAKKAKVYTRGLTLLLVEDDPISLDIYQEGMKKLFSSVDVAVDGKEAYDKWSKNKDGYDLIITDIMMPEMDGLKLISKIREISVGQKFMVLSSIEDMNEMREVINLGIDGIITKPYNQNIFLTIGYRVFKALHNKKIVKSQFMQLKLLSQNNLKLQKKLKHNVVVSDKREPKIAKTAKESISSLVEKYKTRESLNNIKSSDFITNLDFSRTAIIDDFQEKLGYFEGLLCNGSFMDDIGVILEDLINVSIGLSEFISVLNSRGEFPVAANAAENLVVFLEKISIDTLKEKEKRELMIDRMIYLLHDVNAWIITVFIKHEVDNVNYFDASFANSCLEIETIFNESDEEVFENSLEFF